MPMNTTLRHAAIERRVPARVRAHDLLDDLADRQVAGEAGLPGGAEPARHRAAGLAADAHRGPVAVQHQHGLDPAPAVELPQELDRVAAVADRLGDRLQRRRQLARPARRAAPSADRSSSAGSARLLVQPVPHLVEPVARLAVEQLGELVAVERRIERRRSQRHGVAVRAVGREPFVLGRCGRGTRRGWRSRTPRR